MAVHFCPLPCADRKESGWKAGSRPDGAITHSPHHPGLKAPRAPIPPLRPIWTHFPPQGLLLVSEAGGRERHPCPLNPSQGLTWHLQGVADSHMREKAEGSWRGPPAQEKAGKKTIAQYRGTPTSTPQTGWATHLRDHEQQTASKPASPSLGTRPGRSGTCRLGVEGPRRTLWAHGTLLPL